MTLKELKEKEQELNKRVAEVGNALKNGSTDSLNEEYSKLYSERGDIKRQIEVLEREELRNAGKRPLPDQADSYLTIDHYFDKKAELEARETEFKLNFEKAERHLQEVSDKYDDAVLNGTDDKIGALYDELQKAKRDKGIAQSKLNSLKQNSKQRVLEDTAMEVMLSRPHIHDLFEKEHTDLKKRHDKAKQALEAVENEIKTYNRRYENKLNEYQQVMTDLGDNSGLGVELFPKYQKRPADTGARLKIDI